jgi:hypothetical protein
MAQTMYAHVNKRIIFLKSIKKKNEVGYRFVIYSLYNVEVGIDNIFRFYYVNEFKMNFQRWLLYVLFFHLTICFFNIQL